MKSVFFITSAINTKFGIFDSEQRLSQTMATVASIRRHAASADIYWLEMSAEPLTDQQRNQITNSVDKLIDFTQDATVRQLYHSSDNWDIVKNVNEVQCFQRILTNLVNSQQLDAYQRCFKISGRYTLNDQFRAAYYDQHLVQNAIVLARRRNSQFPAAITGGIVNQYMSRLWSWPTALTAEIILTYQNGLEYMFERLAQGGYADIEHVLFHFLDPDKIIELDAVGIQGRIGPNGVAVQD
jgi:hypothetical protein